MSKSKTYKVGRKAGNGRFCTLTYANNHPKTTVVETMRK